MVAGLHLTDIVVRYAQVTAVDRVSLHVPTGAITGLLGPSGCGKTSLLRAVVGLEPLASGQIRWDGEDLAGITVHKRNIGLVFQDAQLFPSMNVAKNVGYGISKWPRRDREHRVAALLELVGLAGYGDRKPSELSGGQAQRVALARSLAPAPRALLLDEPLSALDPGLRGRLAEDLRRILRETGTTALYITHDHQEAFAIADEVAVMEAGRLVQRDSPEALRHAPATQAVAAFLGYRTVLTQATAQRLGWTGELPVGSLLGVGLHSFDIVDDGLEVPVLDEGFAPDHVEIGIGLPDGQRAVIAHGERLRTATVRVRLSSGVITPA
ncbi:MAG: ABC transporter ATP-binding protein [Arachnia sp.]